MENNKEMLEATVKGLQEKIVSLQAAAIALGQCFNSSGVL